MSFTLDPHRLNVEERGIFYDCLPSGWPPRNGEDPVTALVAVGLACVRELGYVPDPITEWLHELGATAPTE